MPDTKAQVHKLGAYCWDHQALQLVVQEWPHDMIGCPACQYSESTTCARCAAPQSHRLERHAMLSGRVQPLRGTLASFLSRTDPAAACYPSKSHVHPFGAPTSFIRLQKARKGGEVRLPHAVMWGHLLSGVIMSLSILMLRGATFADPFGDTTSYTATGCLKPSKGP